MTSTAIQQELERLADVAGESRDARVTVHRRHLETLLWAARLDEAIARADRWYALREATLRGFDQRATATVRQLVSDARVRPSLAWSPS